MSYSGLWPGGNPRKQQAMNTPEGAQSAYPPGKPQGLHVPVPNAEGLAARHSEQVFLLPDPEVGASLTIQRTWQV